MNYIYETKQISSGKKVKYCDACGKTIGIGKPSITITYHTDDGFAADTVCNEKCEKIYRENFDKSDEDDE
jgi:hypothetical protein